jgi:hypothetical protein
MVLGISEQSGGKLYHKSKPGEGTTAELCLPRNGTMASGPTSANSAIGVMLYRRHSAVWSTRSP